MASNDKIKEAQEKVEAVTVVMHKNLESALRNTDRIDTLEEKSNDLLIGAGTFRDRATVIKRTMCLNNLKMKILWIVLILIIIGVIIGIIYGVVKSYYPNQ